MAPAQVRDHRRRSQDTPVVAAASYAATVLAMSGLVGYWRLGEPSGTVVADQTGHPAGAYVGTPTLGVTGALAGDPDTAATFNGSSQYVRVPYNAAYDLADVVGISAWINRSGTGIYGFIVSKGTSAYSFRVNAADGVELIRSGVAVIVSSTIPVPAGWHHVAATKNGAACKLYIDAVDVTGAITNSTCVNNGLDLGIGTDMSGSAPGTAGQLYTGSLDEISLFNRVITPAEVATLQAFHA